MSTSSLQERRVVIVGGGIIGCTAAYYLTCHPCFATSNTHITLLEASTIAAGASGKAGGLVAKWAYPTELAAVSFEEHKRLAAEHGGAGRWGWREVACGQWEGRAGVDSGGDGGKSDGDAGLHGRRGVRPATGLPDDLDWIDETLTDTYEPMAGPSETAQVHPYEFTTSMLALARNMAGERLEVIERAKVVLIERRGDRAGEKGTGERVVGVTYEHAGSHAVHIPADSVLLAAGPWSPTLHPSLPITSTRAHSIVIEPAAPLTPYVIFTSICSPDSKASAASPEIYPRPHNRVYACGSGDDTPLPALASLVKTSPTSIAALHAQVCSLSTSLRNGTVEVEQACYLPLGGPIIGAVDSIRGLIIATGHTCWGICNAPATGKAVSELVMEGSLGETWRLGELEPRWFSNN